MLLSRKKTFSDGTETSVFSMTILGDSGGTLGESKDGVTDSILVNDRHFVGLMTDI